jgi:hypothetical protein
MRANDKRLISRKKLVNILHRLGFADVTERRIDRWREVNLLPSFDVKGRGFGKGRGRAPSGWSKRRETIEQAIWIYRLLAIYGRVDNLYLPLWMLGFRIPIKLVRNDLLEPLNNVIESFRSEAVALYENFGEEVFEPSLVGEKLEGILEDYINQLIADGETNEVFKALRAPYETIEALLNLFLNVHFDLSNTIFEDGFNSISQWNEREKEIEAMLSQGLPSKPVAVEPPNTARGIEMFFYHAPFFQDHFSLQAIRDSIMKADKSDFSEVQIDMKIIREIVFVIGKALVIETKKRNVFPLPTLNEVLPNLFTFGRMLILADFSLRLKGHGVQINFLRNILLQKIKEDFSRVVKENISELDDDLVRTLEKGAKIVFRNFEVWIQDQSLNS